MPKTADYSYELPENLIAKQPPAERGASRLLVLNRQTGQLADRYYRDLPDYLQAGDVMVLNDSKVIPARLKVTKPSGVERELILIEQHGQRDDWHKHKVLYRGRLQTGEHLTASDGSQLIVEELLGDGLAVVSSQTDLLQLALTIGEVPLPPYLHRAATAADRERYQTVWARAAGSVAAPTASLNLTAELLDQLAAKGVIICYITLHIGLGTFMPIRSDDLSGHTMHQEYFEIPAASVKMIRDAKEAGRRIVAVGTTVTRTLEYAADAIASQSPRDLSGEADIFIYPGYRFKIIDVLLTNFHAPRSTVLMLAAAFAGWEQLLAAYQHALATDYRFLSYGDSMLIVDGASA